MKRIDTRIRPEVQNVLGRLKNGIRWYVLIEGITLIVVLAALLFWISMSIDGLWFAAKKYELARWFRRSYIVFALSLIGLGIVYWIAMRLFRSIRSKPLALVLERRFPELNDKLVTSVELSKSISGHETDLTVELLNRTVEAAAQEARGLKVADVFETRPVRWACIGALAAILSVVSYGAAYPKDMQRWVDCWWDLNEEYVDRDTRLTVHVFDESADRVREFNEQQEYRHPLGGDLTLIVRVPEKDSKGKVLVVPEEVYVEYQLGNEGSKRANCKKTGKREFRVSFGAVREKMVFWVVGNDFKNRKPYTINLVAPPEVDEINLRCDYPSYTDLNSDRAVDKSVTVSNNKVTIPLETRFLMEVKTNNEIIRARIEFGRYQLNFGWMPRADASGLQLSDPTKERDFKATLTATGLSPAEVQLMQSLTGLALNKSFEKRKFTYPIPDAVARDFFGLGEGPGLKIPFLISAQKTSRARDRLAEEFGYLDTTFAQIAANRKFGHKGKAYTKLDGAQAKDGDDKVRAFEPSEPVVRFVRPFLMPPDTEIRITLEDNHEINSAEPQLLIINGDPDPPPNIEARRLDIGNAIMRTATIPIEVTIVDEKYGVKRVRLEYRVAPKGRATTEGQLWKRWSIDDLDDDTPEKRRVRNGRWPRTFSFKSLRNGKVVKYELLRAADVKVEDESGMDKVKRDLAPGDKLTIAVYAEDADNINGPNFRRSAQVFDFRIVSFVELSLILAEKESRLRIDFEKIIAEVEKTRKELVDRKLQMREWVALKAKAKVGQQDQLDKMMTAIRLTAIRAQAQLRKNHNETQAVEQGFRQLLAEIVNNGIPVTTERLERLIIGELLQANGPQRGTRVETSFGRIAVGEEFNVQTYTKIDDKTAKDATGKVHTFEPAEPVREVDAKQSETKFDQIANNQQFLYIPKTGTPPARSYRKVDGDTAHDVNDLGGEVHKFERSDLVTRLGDYSQIDRALGRYRVEVDTKDANGDPRELSPTQIELAIDESIAETDELLVRLKAVLKEMNELVKFHEAVKILAIIIKDEKELIDTTRDLLQKSILDP